MSTIRSRISTTSPETLKSRKHSSPSFSQRAIPQTLTSTAQLANLLPRGTVLAFQLLTPIFTNNGACDSVTRPLTFLLLGLLVAFWFLASITDSVRSTIDGQVYYGLATFKGMFLFNFPDDEASGLLDLSKYKMKLIDGLY